MPILSRRARHISDSISSDHRRIGAIIGQHSSLKETDVVELFKEARTKDAVWAQDVGIIHDVREPKIPAGVPIHSLIFPR